MHPVPCRNSCPVLTSLPKVCAAQTSENHLHLHNTCPSKRTRLCLSSTILSHFQLYPAFVLRSPSSSDNSLLSLFSLSFSPSVSSGIVTHCFTAEKIIDREIKCGFGKVDMRERIQTVMHLLLLRMILTSTAIK